MSPRSAAVSSFAAALALVGAAAPAAGTPVTFALHGHLSGSAGIPVADGKYAVAARIYEAADAKVPLFEEFFLSVPVGQGLFARHLGDNPKVVLDHAALVGKELWFGLTIADDPELPRQRLRPVPAAVQAHVAFDVQCSGCVTSAKLAAGSVQQKHIDFAYAGSDSKGGPANHALTADKAKLAQQADAADKAKEADSAKKADFAAKADEAQSAAVAAKLQCTGCVKPEMLDATVLAPYAWVFERQVTGKEPSNNLDTCNRIKITHQAGGVDYGGPYRIVITSNVALTLIQ
ncbi:MAG: hypothetical protein EXR79_14460 [Myxococcales bacterium]|nr:hypothetical protein [Myxococcales bacterium]